MMKLLEDKIDKLLEINQPAKKEYVKSRESGKIIYQKRNKNPENWDHIMGEQYQEIQIESLETPKQPMKESDEEEEPIIKADIPKICKKTKKRKTKKYDQNQNKKYYRHALKIVKNFDTFKLAAPYYNSKHRQDFLITMAIIADTYQKLDEFISEYEKETSPLISSTKQYMKTLPKTNVGHQRLQQLIQSCQDSLQSLDYFKRKQIEKCIQVLFQKEMRNRNKIIESFENVELQRKKITQMFKSKSNSKSDIEERTQ